MIACIIVGAGVHPHFNLHPLLKEPLRDGPRAISLFTDFVLAPHKPAERNLDTVGQLTDGHHSALTVVDKLSPLISGVDRGQTIFTVPFVGAGGSWAAGGADLVKGIVGSRIGCSAGLFRQAIARGIVAVSEAIDKRSGVRDGSGKKLISRVVAETEERRRLRSGLL